MSPQHLSSGDPVGSPVEECPSATVARIFAGTRGVSGDDGLGAVLRAWSALRASLGDDPWIVQGERLTDELRAAQKAVDAQRRQRA